MTSLPRISVIIPSLNQGIFIEETILSIVNQSYTNYEIIIIDGGSTDKTLDIIKKHSSKIKYWVSEKDTGQSEAINKGLKKTEGDIITWLNSDDYYELNTLEIIVSEFEANPFASIIHGKAVFFGEHIKTKVIGLSSDIQLHEYLPYMRFPQPSSFFKKEVLNTIGVNNFLHYAMDFELIVKSILHGFKIKRTNHILAHYRLHKNSKSNNDLEFLNEWSVIVYNLFYSYPQAYTYMKNLEDLKLIKLAEGVKYETKINLKKEEIEDIFLTHLDLHYHYNYKLFIYSHCKKISTFLKSNYYNFYMKNNYRKYNLRLNLIPKFIYKLKNALNN